jgi:hypothetical protein
MELKTKCSHVRSSDNEYRDEGLCNFFQYRDLGIAEATNGRVIAHLVKAKNASEAGTGWHVISITRVVALSRYNRR